MIGSNLNDRAVVGRMRVKPEYVTSILYVFFTSWSFLLPKSGEEAEIIPYIDLFSSSLTLSLRINQRMPLTQLGTATLPSETLDIYMGLTKTGHHYHHTRLLPSHCWAKAYSRTEKA